MSSLPGKQENHERGALESCVEAFEAEFDYIHKALRRHGINDSDADDLTQEVFLIMWRRWVDYDSERPLRPWLAGIAFRVAYNHRDRVSREVPGGLVDIRDQTDGPEDQIASGRVRAMVLNALAQVPEKQRTAMMLHHLDGLGVRDVARLTKVPLFTAYSRLRAGRRSFASAVRRLSSISGSGAWLPARPLALLEPDGVLVETPERRRNKALSRVRAFLAAPVGADLSRRFGKSGRPVVPPPSGSSPLPYLAGLALVGASSLFALLISGPGKNPVKNSPVAVAATSPVALPAAFLGDPGHWRRGRARGAPLHAAMLPALRVQRLSAPAVSPARLAEGIAAYWRFDEGRRGTTVVSDVSGHGHDCVPRRIDRRGDWVLGPHGGAVSFGGGAWLECPGVDPLGRGSEEMTIAAWVKPTGPPQRIRALVSRQYQNGRLDSFFLGFREGKLMLASHRWRVTLVAAVPVARDRWVHVTATRDRGRIARLYLDGMEVARKKSGPLSGSQEDSGVDKILVIGAGRNGLPSEPTNERFVGSMDELVMYDRALSSEEIAALAAGAQPALSL